MMDPTTSLSRHLAWSSLILGVALGASPTLARAGVCPLSGQNDRGRPLVRDTPESKEPPMALPENAAQLSIAALGATLVGHAQGRALQPDTLVDGMPEVLTAVVEAATAGRWQSDCLDAMKPLEESAAAFDAAWPKVATRQRAVHEGVSAAAALPEADAITALRALVDWTPLTESRRTGKWERGVVEPRDAETEALLALLTLARAQQRYDLFGDIAEALKTRRTQIFDEASERLLWMQNAHRLSGDSVPRAEYGVFLAELDRRLATARAGFYYRLQAMDLRGFGPEHGEVFGIAIVDLEQAPTLKVGDVVATRLLLDAKDRTPTAVSWRFREEHEELYGCVATNQLCSINWDTGFFNYCERCQSRMVKGPPLTATFEFAPAERDALAHDSVAAVRGWSEKRTLLLVGEVVKSGPNYRMKNAAIVAPPAYPKESLW